MNPRGEIIAPSSNGNNLVTHEGSPGNETDRENVVLCVGYSSVAEHLSTVCVAHVWSKELCKKQKTHFVVYLLCLSYGLTVLPWLTWNLLDWAGLKLEGQPAHLPNAKIVKPCTTTQLKMHFWSAFEHITEDKTGTHDSDGHKLLRGTLPSHMPHSGGLPHAPHCLKLLTEHIWRMHPLPDGVRMTEEFCFILSHVCLNSSVLHKKTMYPHTTLICIVLRGQDKKNTSQIFLQKQPVKHKPLTP